MSAELPPLPLTRYVLATEGDGFSPSRFWSDGAYNEDQMRAYASAAVSAATQAMEAELAKLRADLEKARAEIAFLDGDLLYWVGRAVSKGNANSDTEEAWERYEQWLRDR